MDSVRIDKWLWAARFYKTRALAVDEIALGRVTVNGQSVKPAREVKPGDTVKVEQSLITVESDKASMEIPSSAAGVVKELRVKLGDKVARSWIWV